MISCLCPTYNRYPHLGFLLDEAVACFLLQDFADKELIVCNDTPGQTLHCDHPQVRVLNVPQRFASLGEKLRWMIERARGEWLCRWDDDDLSLPTRLSLSFHRLGDRLHWRATNYWYDDGVQRREVVQPGNTHLTALWRRAVLARIGGYPVFPLGGEDQAFNAAIARAGIADNAERLSLPELFYVYRWNTGSRHLSGLHDGSANPHLAHWQAIGQQPIAAGQFTIEPTLRAATRARYEESLRGPYTSITSIF